MKMYQKKVTKQKAKEVVCTPDLQYVNIYANSIKRLSCFSKITQEFDDYCIHEEDEEFFHGDATAYEQHLDEELIKVANGFYGDEQSFDERELKQQHLLIQQLQQTLAS